MPSRPTVETPGEIIRNVRYFLGMDRSTAFQSDSVKGDAKAMLKRGRNFVSVRLKDRLVFAPSRFVGYKDNEFRAHQRDYSSTAGKPILPLLASLAN